jgi:hypothetical protein
MNVATKTTPNTLRPRSGQRNHRLIRQLHLWIGAWGALAAIVYGFTGLVMNHRSGDNPWPQGESIEAGRVVLEVPAQARASAEDLSKWLLQAQGLDAQLWHRPLVGPMVVFAEPGEAWALHLIAGQARFADDSALPDLAAGDTALLQAGNARLRHVIDGGGELLVARLSRSR